jgi:DNA-binding MarR family transcriptional regulator
MRQGSRRVRTEKRKRARSKNKAGGQIDLNSRSGQILKYIKDNQNQLAAEICSALNITIVQVGTSLRSLLEQGRVKFKMDKKQPHRRRYFVGPQ